MSAEAAPTTSLSRPVRVTYALSALPSGIKLQSLGLLLFFYNQIVGLPSPMVSLALSISLFFDAFWDPFIGQYSDNLRSRWGRRHPLIYFSIVPVVVSFWMLWNPPSGLTDVQLFTYLLVLIMSVRLFTSFYEVPTAALVPELAPDYNERTVLMSYRYLAQTVGKALTATLAFKLFLRDTEEFPRGQLNPDGWGPWGITLALIIGGSLLVSALGTQRLVRGFYEPPKQKFDLKRTAREVVATLNNWNFGVAMAAGILFGVTQGMVGGLSIYFATYFWELPSRNVWFLVMLTLISAPIAGWLAPQISKRWDKRRAYMLLMSCNVLVGGAPIVLRLLGWFPHNGSPWLMPILTIDSVVAGIFQLSGFILVSSMIADITEESQVKTGRRSEGLLGSADSILNKVVNSLASLIPGLLLVFVGFPDKAKPGMVDPEVLRHLGMVYVPLTAGTTLLSVATWSLFRIDKAAHDRNLATVRQATALAEQRIENLESPPGVGPR